jgi:uncharacterized DUF497 family protein
MAFVWDPKKAEENFAKHHVRFSTAEKIFDDPLRIKRRDTDSSFDEERWQTIGEAGVPPDAGQQTLFVAYTDEETDDVRLISARLATPKERRIYYGAYTAYPYGWIRAES